MGDSTASSSILHRQQHVISCGCTLQQLFQTNLARAFDGVPSKGHKSNRGWEEVLDAAKVFTRLLAFSMDRFASRNGT